MNQIFVSWITAYVIVLVGGIIVYLFTPDKKGEYFDN